MRSQGGNATGAAFCCLLGLLTAPVMPKGSAERPCRAARQTSWWQSEVMERSTRCVLSPDVRHGFEGAPASPWASTHPPCLPSPVGRAGSERVLLGGSYPTPAWGRCLDPGPSPGRHAAGDRLGLCPDPWLGQGARGGRYCRQNTVGCTLLTTQAREAGRSAPVLRRPDPFPQGWAGGTHGSGPGTMRLSWAEGRSRDPGVCQHCLRWALREGGQESAPVQVAWAQA